MDFDFKSAPSLGDMPFDWLESTTQIIDPEGNLIEAGTCLRLNDNILFLKSFSNEQLMLLSRVVKQAVDHELNKRK